jgi:hypothetical protein
MVFKPASFTEVDKLLLSSPYKSCEFEPIYTFLLQSYIHTLTFPITNLINLSLSSGVFPSHCKRVHLIPLLKTTYLPANNLNSNRPIPSFISKVLEKAVSRRLNVHLNRNHLTNVFQSAYKQFHSTQTALLKVYNNIALNMDTGKDKALTLLDLSAAFDIIDYSVRLDRLSDWYDI